MLFDQKSLFPESKAAQKAQTPHRIPPKSRPIINLMSGLDKTTLQSESIYILRTIANQQLNQGNASNFMETMACEIAIKSGKVPLCEATRQALMKRYINP